MLNHADIQSLISVILKSPLMFLSRKEKIIRELSMLGYNVEDAFDIIEKMKKEKSTLE